MKKKYLYFGIAAFLFILMVLSIIRPVPSCNHENCLEEEGRVQRIFEGGEKDIIFELYETERKYYINRGIEQGLNIDSLRSLLIGNEVSIRYPKHWTILDPKESTKHISELVFEGEVLFTEID